MDLFERIKHNFNENQALNQKYSAELVANIASASERIVQCLLSSNKILVCGNAGSAALAQYFSSLMLNRFESEPPSPPAIAIGGNLATTSAIAIDSGFNDIYAKPIKALGQQNDILLTISSSGNSTNLLEAVNVAHNRGLKIIALSGNHGGQLATELNDDDIHICVDHPSSTRTLELHLLIIHCLCDIIDRQLFSNEE